MSPIRGAFTNNVFSMLKYTLLVCLLLNAYWLTAQNLVPNPSFESFKKDPCLARFRTGDATISDYMANWYMPSPGTTDIWDSDPSKKGTCILYIYDSLKAHSGHYLIGLFTLYQYDTVHFNFSNTPPSAFLEIKNYREYLQVRLSKPLIVGKVYRAEMFAAFYRLANFQTNNLGMLFSEAPITQTTTKPPILKQPQVVDTTIIADTNWHPIRGEFVAGKPYQYLTLGNFFDDDHTKIKLSGPNLIYAPGAYYYLDDISVEEVPDTPLVTVPSLGVDTTLCINQSLTLNLPDKPQTTYRWQDGSTAPNRTITQTGTYYVTATTGAYSVTDTLYVKVLPPIQLPSDTVLCRGERFTLAPTYPTKTFLWSDGSRDSSLSVSQTGQYWVSMPNPYCTIADTINVQVADCPGIPPNVITPNGDGLNEAFVIDNVTLLPWHLQIYNRWGARVFQSLPYHNEWRGEGLPTGVYYYELFSAPLRRRLKGWVTIMR